MDLKTKNDCPHKIDGHSSIIVYNEKGLKYFCKCNLCREEFILKRKQIPTDAQWEFERSN